MNIISATLKNLGQNGARTLQMLMLSKNARWLHDSGLESITLDADSTVKSVCGNQEGAEKGYNTTKKGAKSYHLIMVFFSEMKLLYQTWFSAGSTYTSGIVDSLKEVKGQVAQDITKVLFRAVSGFFAGGLFDLLESFGWDYLIKVKLKNLEKILQSQTWVWVEGKEDVAIYEFSYMTKGWSKPWILKAMCSIKEYAQVSYIDQEQIVPVYQYVCCASSYDRNVMELHELYKQRSTNATWIKCVKGHTMAGGTLTDDLWANDILWQLSVIAYNISIMMRQRKQVQKTGIPQLY